MQSGTVHIEIRITQNNTKLPNMCQSNNIAFGGGWIGGVRWGGAAQTTKLKTPEFY